MVQLPVHIMDAPPHVNILDTTMLPFIAQKFPSSQCFMATHRFMADNKQQFLKEKHVNWWRTPAGWPDINTTENLWHKMEYMWRGEAEELEGADQLNEGILEDSDICINQTRHSCLTMISETQIAQG